MREQKEKKSKRKSDDKQLVSSVAAAAPDALCMLCRWSVACMGVDVVRGPRGERNRDFKQDRYTCETKELLAIAPRGEVEKVLAEILVCGQQAANSQDVLQMIEQIVAQAVRSK